MGWVVNATPRPLRPRGRDPVPIEQEAVPLTGIRCPDRSARSESPYRLRYPDPRTGCTWEHNIKMDRNKQEAD